jgi:hypothetical protein
MLKCFRAHSTFWSKDESNGDADWCSCTGRVFCVSELARTRPRRPNDDSKRMLYTNPLRMTNEVIGKVFFAISPSKLEELSRERGRETNMLGNRRIEHDSQPSRTSYFMLCCDAANHPCKRRCAADSTPVAASSLGHLRYNEFPIEDTTSSDLEETRFGAIFGSTTCD